LGGIRSHWDCNRARATRSANNPPPESARWRRHPSLPQVRAVPGQCSSNNPNGEDCSDWPCRRTILLCQYGGLEREHAFGRLGRLAAVTKEARGASEVGDDGQEAHASTAARASFDIDAKGTLEQLCSGAIARAVQARRRRVARLLLAGGRLGGLSCRLLLRHYERTPLGGGSEHARVPNRMKPRSRDERNEPTQQRQRVQVDRDVPSLNGFLSAMRTSPSGTGSRRSVASGGRRMYLSSASRPCSSAAARRGARSRSGRH
jgi:hypothetical protein